jgi:small ligand-binding sensory domain FIST
LGEVESVKFSAALSVKTDWTEVVTDLCDQVRAGLGEGDVHVGFLFAHFQYVSDLREIADSVREKLGIEMFVACTGSGVIGVDREMEKRGAVSLLAGRMPDVDIQSFHVTEDDVEEAGGPSYWHYKLGLEPEPKRNLMIFGDPFSIASIRLVNELTEAYPGAPLLGGLVSGGQDRGEHQIILNDKTYTNGAVGLSFSGNVALHAVVSMGCRPIGQPLIITRAEKNVIFEMGGRPPIHVLHDMLPTLPERDQQLAKSALLLGRVINEYQEDYLQGDFLIRNLIGGDDKSGALAVGDYMHTGQTVQFQVRDGQTAHDDLRHGLVKVKQGLGDTPVLGSLAFICLGRGQSMYGAPSHDVRLLRKFFPELPVAGFFCNGEIGPVGDRSYVHGFTTVLGLFTQVRTTD